jgi:hypothetical protein
MKNLYRPLFAGAACLLGTAAATAQQSFQTTSQPVGTNPQATEVADLDRDGWLDLATTSESPEKITIRYGDGPAGYFAPVTVPLSAGVLPTAIASGDLDGDGDVDLVVGQRGNNSVLVVVNQAGTYVPTSTFQVGADPRDIKIADLDNDQDLDIVIANRGSDSVSIVRNMGALDFTAIGYPAGVSPREIEIAELTGDGLLDIAVAAYGSQAIQVLRNTGSAAFTTHAQLSTAPFFPEGLAIARIDLNATRDIAASVTHPSLPQQAWVWAGDGLGGFTNVSQVALGGAGAKHMVAADFDLDGDRDLATANSLSNDVSVIFYQGAGAFSAPQQTPVGQMPVDILLGDFDFNGGPDVLTTDQVAGTITLALNTYGGCAAQNYCNGSVNSAGQVAKIGASGSPSMSSTFEVLISNALPNNSATLFYSVSGPQSAPFQGGTLCAQPPLVRMPTTQLDANGSASYEIHVEAPMVGTQRWYQFTYRDPQNAGGHGVAFTDGLATRFCN